MAGATALTAELNPSACSSWLIGASSVCCGARAHSSMLSDPYAPTRPHARSALTFHCGRRHRSRQRQCADTQQQQRQHAASHEAHGGSLLSLSLPPLSRSLVRLRAPPPLTLSPAESEGFFTARGYVASLQHTHAVEPPLGRCCFFVSRREGRRPRRPSSVCACVWARHSSLSDGTPLCRAWRVVRATPLACVAAVGGGISWVGWGGGRRAVGAPSRLDRARTAIGHRAAGRCLCALPPISIPSAAKMSSSEVAMRGLTNFIGEIRKSARARVQGGAGLCVCVC